MNRESYELGVSEFTTWPWTFEQDVDHYSRLGAQTIEVCEFKLNADRAGMQLASVADHGLRISSIQPRIRTLFPSKSQPEPTSVPDRMERFRGTIEDFGVFASGVPFVTNTGIPPKGDIQRVLDVAVREYRALARFAGDFRASIALEPLNPSIMNLESAIWTVQQAAEIVQAVDLPNFGICLDFWNVWQNPGLEEAIQANADRILVVQLSDWRTPRSDQDRLIPGQGAIPLPRLMSWVRESGFDGAYSIEIFSGGVPDSLWEGNLEQVIRQSKAGADIAWEESFRIAEDIL